MLKLNLSVLFFFFLFFLNSQSQRYISLEVGGAGGLGSINFEKEFHKSEQLRFIFRTGFSFIPIDRNNGNSLIFPQMVHAVYGKKSHHIDFGIGLAPSFTTRFAGAYIRAPLSLGYRFEAKDKKHVWRVAYTPLTSFLFDFQWEHWAGITYAYKLGQKKNKE
jgi:hypothetical protein